MLAVSTTTHYYEGVSASWKDLQKLLLTPIPELGDPAKALKLESLTLKQCQVSQDAIIEVLAISPWLLELALVAIWNDLPERTPQPTRPLLQEQLTDFIHRACPKLRRLHYSIHLDFITPRNLQRLIQDNHQVTEWSFMSVDLSPDLCQQLSSIQNTITKLEITGYAPGMDICFTAHGLNNVARQASIGIAHIHNRATANSLGVSETAYTSAPDGDAQRLRRPASGPASRVVFGYLSRVCPALKELYFVLDDLALDLQSGLCLLSWLQQLEVAVITVPQREHPHWLETLDLSWMAQYPLSPWRKLVRHKDMRKWEGALREEEDLVRRREEYLEATAGRALKEEEDGSVLLKDRHWGGEIAYPLAHLGTLTDVKNCLEDMTVKGKHRCWPRLQRFQASLKLDIEHKKVLSSKAIT
ncbi:hypothetical protein BGZ82_010005 [Podila clonocystis]|nr:hypothetical protein BGZ82_010005 [Podila clonocystis]